VRIRDAVEADLADIVETYNASVVALTGGAWSETPQTLDERVAWFRARQANGEVVLVAEADGQIVGFAAYGEFRDNELWPGYRFTVENTVHVRQDRRRTGVGIALLRGLIEAARANGKHAMVAAIDGANEASIRFHERLGFFEVARMPEIGAKFGRWQDLVLLQLRLDDRTQPDDR